MIPDIGLMIGVYILTRMIEILENKDKGIFLKICAAITMVLIIVLVADLLMQAVKTSAGMIR